MKSLSLIALLGFLILGSTEARQLPYATTKDILASEVVFTDTEYCVSRNQPVKVIGLHHGSEWWKLWIAPNKRWVFGFYGDSKEAPAGEAYATQIYFGLLVDSSSGDQSQLVFQLISTTPFDQNNPDLCVWLYPKEA